MSDTPDYFFLDGALLGPGDIALAAQYNACADAQASRLLLWLQGQWTYLDFDEDVIRSLAFEPTSASLYMLGKSGKLYRLGGRGVFSHASIAGTLTEEQLVDPDDRGELLRIRVLEGRLLACGLGGQVLERREDGWRELGFDTPIAESPDFEDLALDERGQPLAVGWGGAVYRFGARGPAPVALPSNLILSSIVAAGERRHLLCGNRGVVFELLGEAVRDLSIDEPQGNLWSLAEHAGLIYACEPGRLLVREDGQWREEKVSRRIASPTFNRLLSSGPELWSFGVDHVFVRRGDGRWEQFPVIGNEA